MKTLSTGWSFTSFVSNLKRSASLGITLLSLILPASSLAQQIKFEQGQNGGVGRPAVSPVNWETGNSHEGNSHYTEGQSVPYRVSISNIAPGPHTLIIEWDHRRNAKTAIDYATDYQLIAETVNPLRGLTGSYGQPAFAPIPAPQLNVLVAGHAGTQLQPIYSFNQLPDSKRRMTFYNATPGPISYAPEGSPTASSSSSRLKIEFTVTGTTAKNVVLAWGGHISSRLDWGAPNAASDISGSPYHTRIVSLDGKAGNQDRSLKTAAISFVPTCDVVGSKTFCTDITYQYTAKTNAPTPHYAWSVTGGTIISGQGTEAINVNWNANSQGVVAVTIFDQSSIIPSVSTNCSIQLTRDVICPYYTPSANGKVNTPIGSELTQLHSNFIAGNPVSSNFIYTISGNQVLIEVIAAAGQFNSLLATLKSPAYGLNNEIDNDNNRIITGFFPIANLPLLNSLPAVVKYVRPAYPPVTNVGTTTTKGDSAQHSGLARLGYGISGKSIKVGVLSDSYNVLPGNPAGANISNNDLPKRGVNMKDDSPFGGIDEGRAMLQIVHDVAPDAKLAFRTGIRSSGDFAKGIKELQLDTCDIIVDDLTYLTEPFFQDGEVANAVDYVTSLGVSYFTAAGNFGNKSYEGTFAPAPAPPGVTGVAHSYSGTDIFQKITLGPGTYTIVLQWDDPIYSLGQTQTGAINDLDFYLTTDAGTTLFGFNRNNLGIDPVEILPFTVLEEATTNIMIIRAAGTTNVKFKFIVFRGDKFVFNEHNPNGSSTIVGQANAKGAMTVGAVLYSNTAAFGYKGPVNVTPFTVASFSSIGGNPIQGEDRLKPDFIAPNGGNTTVELGGLDVDYDLPAGKDNFYNFFGTSASAPHAAGVAALLMEARSKFYNGEKYTPGEMRQVLKASALDMHEQGPDVKSGAGFIQANAALLTIAAPKPTVTALLYDSTITPGESEFIVTVQGQNLTPASEILLRGEPLETTFINSTELQAPIPEFEGNPSVQVLTSAFSPSGLDGGTSNPLFFNGLTKQIVKVIADDQTKKYGEILPVFTATILVDDDTLTTSSELTLADLGLTQLEFETPAHSLINADKYVIEVKAAVPDSFKELFSYTFVQGILTVEKMPLQITPDSLEVLYGEKFDDKITFSYEYDDSNIAPHEAGTFLNTLILDHKAIMVENAIALVDSRALANSRPIANSDLVNLSFLASARAIANSRAITNRSRAITNSTNVVDFDKQSIFNYLENPDTAELITAISNSRPLVNRTRAIVNARAIANSRAIVSYSSALVNRSRAIVSSRAITNSGAVVNSETVGADSVNSNSGAVVIIDSLDIFNDDPPIIENGIEYYELPELFSINMVTGITAGTHFIVPGAFLTDLSNNFEVTYKTGKLKIRKETLTVTAPSAEIVYGIPQPTYGITANGYKYDDIFSTVVESITFKLEDVNNVNENIPGIGIAPAGTYRIVPVVDLLETALQPGDPVNYVVSVIYGTLTVKKAPLVVKPDDKVIIAGQIPPYTSTYTGLQNNDLPSGLLYTTSPNYSGLAGVYTINAEEIQFVLPAVPGNYEITYSTGTLYVNPGTSEGKAIRPILRCVEEVKNNPTYTFRARFEYQNDNTTPVFIGRGPENLIVATGPYSGTQPELFQPGSGSFDILFTGSKLTWTLVSDDKGKKTSIGSEASSTSTRCKKGNSAGREAFETEVPVEETSGESLSAYPNPVVDAVSIALPEAEQGPSASDIVVMDQVGRTYVVQSSWSQDDNLLTIDFSSLESGMYIIKISFSEGVKTLKVYKE